MFRLATRLPIRNAVQASLKRSVTATRSMSMMTTTTVAPRNNTISCSKFVPTLNNTPVRFYAKETNKSLLQAIQSQAKEWQSQEDEPVPESEWKVTKSLDNPVMEFTLDQGNELITAKIDANNLSLQPAYEEEEEPNEDEEQFLYFNADVELVFKKKSVPGGIVAQGTLYEDPNNDGEIEFEMEFVTVVDSDAKLASDAKVQPFRGPDSGELIEELQAHLEEFVHEKVKDHAHVLLGHVVHHQSALSKAWLKNLENFVKAK